MKVLMLTSDYPSQRALACKISEQVQLVGIVYSKNISSKNKKSLIEAIFKYKNKISGRLYGRSLVRSWNFVRDYYAAKWENQPLVPRFDVNHINEQKVFDLVELLKPDLVVVSGTNLLGKKLISKISQTSRITNLHTGLSPYVKGGPNCTNWCLAEDWFHLIGNTVMWLDEGIDSGNIIATERTSLSGRETLDELHLKVMEHAHDLYVRAIKKIADAGPVNSVPQQKICQGRTFFSSEWTLDAVRRAQKNFFKAYHPETILRANKMAESLFLVPLDNQVV